MFAKFNLKLDKNSIPKIEDNYISNRYRKHNKEISECIEDFLSSDGYLDVEKVEQDWFPQIQASVFLSHSHNDEEIALNFANYLYSKFKIETFIDSSIWKSADALLKKIDNQYCSFIEKDKKLYNYNRRNMSTSHVHAILNGALAKMINRCECLIFINTPESLCSSNIGNEDYTSSPWIYSELLMATTFPVRKPPRLCMDSLLAGMEDLNESIKIRYKIPLNNFIDISIDDIKKAAMQAKNKTSREILDQLYINKNLSDML